MEAKTKTKGKFIIKSNYDKDFIYTGYSRQCEIMFRDYMNWCAKKKAPKALQDHYNKVVAANEKLEKPVFYLEMEAMTEEQFNAVAKKAPVRSVEAPKDFVVPKMGDIVAETTKSAETQAPKHTPPAQGKVFSIPTGNKTVSNKK
jgi:hypothetical protein